jgi:hypothetical protein
MSRRDYNAGWDGAMEQAIRTIQAWEKGEHQITRDLLREIRPTKRRAITKWLREREVRI